MLFDPSSRPPQQQLPTDLPFYLPAYQLPLPTGPAVQPTSPATQRGSSAAGVPQQPAATYLPEAAAHRLRVLHANPALLQLLHLEDDGQGTTAEDGAYQGVLDDVLARNAHLLGVLQDIGFSLLAGSRPIAAASVVVGQTLSPPSPAAAAPQQQGGPSGSAVAAAPPAQLRRVAVPLALHPVLVLQAGAGAVGSPSRALAGVVVRYRLGLGPGALLQQLHRGYATLMSLPGIVTL